MTHRPKAKTSEDSRLTSALRSADAMLLQSLRSEDQARRKRRTITLFAIIGGIPMLAVTIYAALSLHLGSTPAATAIIPTIAAAVTTPATANIPTFKPNDVIEVKSGSRWSAATILSGDHDIYLIRYTKYGKNNFFDEWVTVDRIRTPGDPRDIDFTMPTPHGQKPTAERRAEALKVFDPSAAVPPTHQGQTIPGVPNIPTIQMPTRSEATPAWQNAASLVIADDQKYAPDALLIPPMTAAPIPLQAYTGEFFQKPGAVIISSTGKAAVSFINAPPGDTEHTTVDILDLPKNRKVCSFSIDPGTHPAAISPDGSRIVLLQGNFGFDNNSRVDVLSISPTGQLQNVISFSPYAHSEKFSTDAVWADFADNDHLLTKSSAGLVTLWNIPAATAVWEVDAGRGPHPGLSPNHKYIVLSVKNHPALFETLTGKCAGKLPRSLHFSAYTFSTDGKFLAAVNDTLRVIDLTTNEFVTQTALPPALPKTETIAWVDSAHLLLNNEFLAKSELGLITWDYAPASILTGAPFAGKFWYSGIPRVVGEPGQTIHPKKKTHEVAKLTPLAIPDAPAAASEKIIDPDVAFAIHPGSSVSLDINLAGRGDPAELTKILTDKLAEAHITVADGQPNHLSATISNGKGHELTSTNFMTDEKQTFTAYDLDLALQFTINGTPAWIAKSTYPAPSLLAFKHGSSPQDAINAEQKNAWLFFKSVDLPSRVPTPQPTLGMGKTELTTDIKITQH